MTSSQISTCFVFNGDADGLISQHLMGLSGISPTQRITGLKREIVLLDRISAARSTNLISNIYVFDISLDANRAGLMRLLGNPGVRIKWFDHHEAGMLPDSPQLHARILNTRGTCTALLVHAELKASDPRWAAMAAFGDNIPEAGEALLRPLSISASDTALLREAGQLLNYNAYGETNADVLFQPLDVAERMSRFKDPLEFIRESRIIEPLRAQLRKDESNAASFSPEEEFGLAKIYRFPAEPWARRIGATYVNREALENPSLAFATLHPLQDGSYQVSIRAPRSRDIAVLPASDLARHFPTGGGRALAAGINKLPAAEISVFKRRFFEYYAV